MQKRILDIQQARFSNLLVLTHIDSTLLLYSLCTGSDHPKKVQAGNKWLPFLTSSNMWGWPDWADSSHRRHHHIFNTIVRTVVAVAIVMVMVIVLLIITYNLRRVYYYGVLYNENNNSK